MQDLDEQTRDSIYRTELAAERTWLAWWRTGIAAAAAAIAIGAVLPRVIDGPRTPYILLGVGYALLSIGVFIAAFVRQRNVTAAIARGEDVAVHVSVVALLSVASTVLALATLVVIVVQP